MMVAFGLASWKPAAQTVCAAPCAEEPMPFSVPVRFEALAVVVDGVLPSFAAHAVREMAAAASRATGAPMRLSFTVVPSGISNNRTGSVRPA